MQMLSAPINITELFDGLALTNATGLSGSEDDLFENERTLIANAGDKRKREFISGRVMARKLMAELGRPEQALLNREDRTPIWPEGVIGSISHCDDFCAVAIASTDQVQSLGLDVEPDSPLEDELISELAFGDEIAWIEANGEFDRGRRLRMLFVAKEAAYKCQFPLTGASLEFSDLAVDFAPDCKTFTARLTNPAKFNSIWSNIHGRLLIREGYIFGGAMIRPHEGTQ